MTAPPGERPVLTPLEMALNAAANVAMIARATDDDPVGAHLNRNGERAAAAAELASRLALVSIAEDLHRIADSITERRGTVEDTGP